MRHDIFIALLYEQLNNQLDLVKRMQHDLETLPKGSLEIHNVQENAPKYYRSYMERGRRRRIYIPDYYDGKTELIEDLAKKSVIRYGLPKLKRRINALNDLMSAYEPYEPFLAPHGDMAGKYYTLPGEMNLTSWLLSPCHPNPNFPEARIYETKQGDLVRSKSEAMIADCLYDSKILYRYEELKSLKVNSDNPRTSNFYPDFTIFDVNSDQELIWEHFGMMDNAKYASEALNKIEIWGKNGFACGQNLIVTSEIREQPLTPQKIRQIIANYKLIPR